jgi:hypothetical protein
MNRGGNFGRDHLRSRRESFRPRFIDSIMCALCLHARPASKKGAHDG